MERIIVCDDFLNETERNEVSKIIKAKKWTWGHESNGTELIETPFWSMNLSNEDFFAIHLKNVIEKYFSKKFKLNRVYANGQTFGQDGAYHIDDKGENSYTFCLYMGELDKKFAETAGGHIFFKLPELPYKICYEPIYNRGIFFPSKYLHRSTSFCRYVMNLRICVSWKMEEIIE